jgi:hypothetical protein
MKMNKNTIALVSAFVIASNAHGMWSSITEYVSAAQPAVNTACRKTWSKIKENKGYIGAAATAAGLVYGGFKAYQYYTAQPVATSTPLISLTTEEAIEYLTNQSKTGKGAQQNEEPRLVSSPEEQRGELKANLAEIRTNALPVIHKETQAHNALESSEATIVVQSPKDAQEAFKAQLASALATGRKQVIAEEDEEEPTTGAHDSAISSPSDVQQSAEEIEAARKEALKQRMARLSRASNPAAGNFASFLNARK